MPAKTSTVAIEKIEPDEEMDNLSLKLTDEELDVLEEMLDKQRAFTLGELQRAANAERGKKIAWRRMEGILQTLVNLDLVMKESPPNRDKRAKERLSLAPAFAARWRRRRILMLRICSDFPSTPPRIVLGDSLAKFYLLRARMDMQVEKVAKH